MHRQIKNRFGTAFALACIQLGLVLLFLSPPQASANTYNLPCTADATVKSAFPAQNFGSETSLFAGYSGTTNGNGRTLLQFDLSSFPPTEMDYITDIYLYMNVTQSSTSTAFYIWQSGGSWTESGVTWNNQPGLGGNIENTGSWGSTGYRYIWLSRLGNAWFRNWLRGIDPNYGLLMKNGNEGSPSSPAAFFTSEENSSPSKPLLVVVTSVSPPPSITVTSPNGGENWRRGETHLITWNSVNVSWADKIQVMYSPTVGGSEILIHEVPANYTSDAWTIPTNAPLSSQYRILLRVIYHSTIYALDWSDGTFNVGDIPARILTVNSSNSGGAVAIGVVPNSGNCPSGTSTPFTCTYTDGSSVTLTAPGTAPNGYPFLKWQRNGADYSTSASVSVTMNTDYTMTAVYGQRTLTVNASGSGSSVSITVNPSSCPGGTSTPFTCQYPNNTSVTLTAPATAPNGYAFQKWQRNGADYSTSVGTSVTMDADYTMTVVYGPRVLTVNATGSGSSVSVTVNPSSCSGGTSTPFTCQYSNNTSVTLTAPATAPNGNVFQKWQKDGADVSPANLSTTLTMNSDHVMTVVFTPPTTKTITVTATGAGGGVTISMNPNGCPGGTVTPFSCTYITGTTVVLTAPGSSPSGRPFVKWQKDGVDITPISTQATLYVDNDHTMTAIYQIPSYTLEIHSAPVDGATILVADGTTWSQATPILWTYNEGTAVTLTAPGTYGVREFLKWKLDNVDVEPHSTVLPIQMTANHVAQAVYARRITVSSNLPPVSP